MDKKEPLFEHMRKPLVSRVVTPGASNALDKDELGFLRDLPGPKRLRPEKRSKKSEGRNRMLLAADAVIDYWARDKSRSISDGVKLRDSDGVK